MKGPECSIPSDTNCFENSTPQSVNNLILKVSHLQHLTQTICNVVCVTPLCMFAVLSLMGMSDCKPIAVWAVHDSKCISHVLCPRLGCHAYVAGFRNSGMLGGLRQGGNTFVKTLPNTIREVPPWGVIVGKALLL